MAISELTDPHIKCPNCRFGDLVRLSLNHWKCSTCGYWTVKPPIASLQGSRYMPAGTETPLTSEQKAELKRGREYWKTLIKVGKKVAFEYLITFLALSLSFNLAVRSALDPSLSLSWTITAWVSAVFLGIVGSILFYISSLKRRLVFGVILSFVIITGAFWYELALRTVAIL